MAPDTPAQAATSLKQQRIEDFIALVMSPADVGDGSGFDWFDDYTAYFCCNGDFSTLDGLEDPGVEQLYATEFVMREMDDWIRYRLYAVDGALVYFHEEQDGEYSITGQVKLADKDSPTGRRFIRHCLKDLLADVAGPLLTVVEDLRASPMAFVNRLTLQDCLGIATEE